MKEKSQCRAALGIGEAWKRTWQRAVTKTQHIHRRATWRQEMKNIGASRIGVRNHPEGRVAATDEIQRNSQILRGDHHVL
jgi:hypothetical protein